jgi:hypothetical protein
MTYPTTSAVYKKVDIILNKDQNSANNINGFSNGLNGFITSSNNNNLNNLGFRNSLIGNLNNNLQGNFLQTKPLLSRGFIVGDKNSNVSQIDN